MLFVKTHGGKHRLWRKIIELFPSNYKSMDYVEPFAGGIALLLHKKPSKTETICELHEGTYKLLTQVRDDVDSLIAELKPLVYSNETFIRFLNLKEKSALREFVVRRMSRGGMCKTFAWSERKRGGITGDVNAWYNAIYDLPLVSKRLHKVDIIKENSVNRQYSSNTLCYCDPPYLHETRVSKNVYECEMTREQHRQLAENNRATPAKVLISGYDSIDYRSWYKDWNRFEFNVANNAGQTSKKNRRIEVCWFNY